MDKELQDYYNHYFDLFASNGWQQFVQEINETLSSVNDLSAITDANEFFFRKGKVDVYRQIVAFKDLIERSYKEYEDA